MIHIRSWWSISMVSLRDVFQISLQDDQANHRSLQLRIWAGWVGEVGVSENGGWTTTPNGHWFFREDDNKLCSSFGGALFQDKAVSSVFFERCAPDSCNTGFVVERSWGREQQTCLHDVAREKKQLAGRRLVFQKVNLFVCYSILLFHDCFS